ncbi:hypothetical protein L9F63_022695, partial [Diploptera punctata]
MAYPTLRLNFRFFRRGVPLQLATVNGRRVRGQQKSRSLMRLRSKRRFRLRLVYSNRLIAIGENIEAVKRTVSDRDKEIEYLTPLH